MNGILRKLTLGDLRKPSKPPGGMVLDGRSKEAWSKDGGGLITKLCLGWTPLLKICLGWTPQGLPSAAFWASAEGG